MGAWSHVWSSAVSVDLRRAAWEALELPESFEDCKQEYWNVFQVGSDGPRISLLLHHALGRPGSSVREDWLRVMEHFGRQREVILISGYRSPSFNRLRTKQSRQVGEKSLHMKGQAIDFRVEGVAITRLHEFVKTLKAGGVGFYPDSNFIHMDIGPVRYWSGN